MSPCDHYPVRLVADDTNNAWRHEIWYVFLSFLFYDYAESLFAASFTASLVQPTTILVMWENWIYVCLLISLKLRLCSTALRFHVLSGFYSELLCLCIAFVQLSCKPGAQLANYVRWRLTGARRLIWLPRLSCVRSLLCAVGKPRDHWPASACHVLMSDCARVEKLLCNWRFWMSTGSWLVSRDHISTLCRYSDELSRHDVPTVVCCNCRKLVIELSCRTETMWAVTPSFNVAVIHQSATAATAALSPYLRVFMSLFTSNVWRPACDD